MTAEQSVTIAEWQAMADMLAYVLADKLGVDHACCDPADCAVAFALHRHAEMSA